MPLAITSRQEFLELKIYRNNLQFGQKENPVTNEDYGVVSNMVAMQGILKKE